MSEARRLPWTRIAQIIVVLPVTVFCLFGALLALAGTLGRLIEGDFDWVIPLAVVLLLVTALPVACLWAAILASPETVVARRARFTAVRVGLVFGCGLAAWLLFEAWRVNELDVATVTIYGGPFVLGVAHFVRIRRLARLPAPVPMPEPEAPAPQLQPPAP